MSLDADLRLWRAILGQVHDHATDLAAADSLPEAAVRSAMASIMTESMGGRSTAARDAAALLATAQERLGVLDPAAAAMVGFNEYIHLLSTGEHEKALAFAQARRSDSGDGVGIWTSTVAEHRNYNGRLAVDRETREICEKAVRRLEELGCVVEEFAPDLGAIDEAFMVLRSQYFIVSHAKLMETHRDQIKPDIIWNTEKGLAQKPEQIAWAVRPPKRNCGI